MTTIVLPISRTEYLRPVFNCLNDLDRPKNTELILITDGDDSLKRAVDRRLDSISYASIKIIDFGNSPAPDRHTRRFRISSIHNKVRAYIAEDCDYIFSIEDDTIYPPDALTKLLSAVTSYPKAAFAEAVELGRHKSKYLGAWRVDNIHDPQSVISIMPGEGIEEIDAGGLYCAVIDAELYKAHHFEPYDQVGRNGLSCDVNLGLYLRRKGYKCLVDHSIQCDHIGDEGSVNLGNTKPHQVIFEKKGQDWTSWPRLPVENSNNLT